MVCILGFPAGVRLPLRGLWMELEPGDDLLHHYQALINMLKIFEITTHGDQILRMDAIGLACTRDISFIRIWSIS